MIEKLKKLIEEACDAQFDKGFSAGYNARCIEEKDEHEHNLMDLYRRGYKQGYEEAMAEVGEITIDDLEEL
jgi:hypothetical protein